MARKLGNTYLSMFATGFLHSWLLVKSLEAVRVMGEGKEEEEEVDLRPRAIDVMSCRFTLHPENLSCFFLF